MSHFDPTTWIDEQRQGRGGNVFDSILAAAKSIRSGQSKKADYVAERRIDRVHAIRQEAALFDRAVDPYGGRATVHTLDGEAIKTTGMMHRWRHLR